MHRPAPSRFLSCFALLACALLAVGCGEPKTSADVYEDVQSQLINAAPGDVVEVPAGTWALENTLSLAGVKDVTLRGAGRDETILNFGEQQGGAEGIKVQDADGVTLEALTVQDTGGDGVKVIGSDGATLRDLKVEWTAGSDASNGGYGLYPVSLSGITIENNEVRGAADAGIYLGQARGGVIKNNHVEGNVQGIAIENCIDVEAASSSALGRRTRVSWASTNRPWPPGKAPATSATSSTPAPPS